MLLYVHRDTRGLLVKKSQRRPPRLSGSSCALTFLSSSDAISSEYCINYLGVHFIRRVPSLLDCVRLIRLWASSSSGRGTLLGCARPLYNDVASLSDWSSSLSGRGSVVPGCARPLYKPWPLYQTVTVIVWSSSLSGRVTVIVWSRYLSGRVTIIVWSRSLSGRGFLSGGAGVV